MTLDDLPELHYITPLKNLVSIMQHGILSHERAEKIKHESVAMQEIQDLRADVVLPNHRKLHSYANVYIYARNKMMSKIREHHRGLCVLRLDRRILNHSTAITHRANTSASAKSSPAWAASIRTRCLLTHGFTQKIKFLSGGMDRRCAQKFSSLIEFCPTLSLAFTCRVKSRQAKSGKNIRAWT